MGDQTTRSAADVPTMIAKWSGVVQPAPMLLAAPSPTARSQGTSASVGQRLTVDGKAVNELVRQRLAGS